MREVFGSHESQNGEDVERPSPSKVLERKLQRRRLQMMAAGIPDVTHNADVQITEPQTRSSRIETWEFHGSMLATLNVADYDPRGLVRLKVILGINGELIELHSFAADPYQRVWWNYATEGELADRTDVALAVLAGLDRLIAAGSATERLELAAQSGDMPPNVVSLEAYRQDSGIPPDDSSA